MTASSEALCVKYVIATRFILFKSNTMDLLTVGDEGYAEDDNHIKLPYLVEIPKWLADGIRDVVTRYLESAQYRENEK